MNIEVKMLFVNASKYEKGEIVGKWIDLLDHKEWDKEFASIGVMSNKDCVVCHCKGEFTNILCGLYNDFPNLNILDEFANFINYVNRKNVNAFRALCNLYSFDDAIRIYENDEYMFVPNVNNNTELGKWLLNDYEKIEIPEFLNDYIDYSSYGRDQNKGIFTKWGYIE